MRFLSLFIIALILPLGVSAISGEEFMILSYCKSPKNCGTTTSNLFNILKLKCESDLQSHKCDQLAKENPSWGPLMRRCDTQSLCEQNEEFIKNKNLACLRGYKNAAVDLGIALKDMAVGLGGFVSASWENAKKNTKQRNEFIKECNKSLLCKRDLVKDDPRYNKMTDAQLEKVTAAFLFVQAEDYKGILAAQKRHAHKLSSALPNLREDELDIEGLQKKDMLMALIKESLKKQYDRYVCYDQLAQEELKCYAMGSVLDPLTVAGYFAKAGRVASAVSKGIDAEKTLNRVSDIPRTPIEEKRIYTGASQMIIAKPVISKVATPKSISSLPEALKLDKVTQVDGTSYLRYSFAEELPDGRWVKNSKELPLDNLTGAINANFSTGREFFEKMVKEKAGKSYLTFVDVGSLGAVNKEFKAGTEAGDRYIKAVADEIMKRGEGKVTLARLGGDEFGLLIDSANSQEVQKILRNIQDGLRKDLGGAAHQVFREEKIVRAEGYREKAQALAAERPGGVLTAADKQELRKDIDELAKIQQPDISIGTIQVGHNDDLSHLLEKAEGQAKAMKVETVLNFGRSAEKYGSDAIPRAKPNPLYQGEILKPLESDSWTSTVTSAKRGDLDKMALMRIERKAEVARFGTTTLARYEDELGRSSYRVEKYFTDKTGMRQRISSEIPTRGHTGLLDGLHPESQNLVLDHLRNSSDTTLLMPKLKSLRYLNYFESGTKAGDDVLEAVAKAIRENTRANDLSFKLGGADFLVSIKNTDAKGVSQVSKKISEAVKNNPEVRAILEREKMALTQKLLEADRKGDLAAKERFQKKIQEFKNFDLDLSFESVSSNSVSTDASFKDIIETLEGKFKR